MRRLLFILLALLLLPAVLALWVLSRPDPRYTLEEWASLGRYGRYDPMIADVAARHGVDPRLVKAVVWQESRFHPEKTGTSGERGLMQVGEAAAADWAKANRVETFLPNDLYSPRTNLEIGTWYLGRALRSWEGKDDPLPFALAEYNAGRRHVHRWIRENALTPETIDSARFRPLISYPTTRAYISAIERRFRAYRTDSPEKP